MKPLKANFILGKKQIILASLVLILGVAVYLNWQFANSNNGLDLTTALDETQSAQDTQNKVIAPEDAVVDETGAKVDEKVDTQKVDAKKVVSPDAAVKTDADPVTAKETTKKTADETATKGKNLGDTLLVSSKSIADETYFAMAKFARTKTRDQSIETISTVLNDTKLTEDDKKAVSAKAMAITDIIEAESRIENLIKAKGFEECVVYITDKNANVVVKTDGLDQDKATQIKNIIVSEGKIKGENVSITEIN
ncbi:MAG: SpoIIIAH-like family protein [Oscillospiraceae bacterium]